MPALPRSPREAERRPPPAYTVMMRGSFALLNQVNEVSRPSRTTVILYGKIAGLSRPMATIKADNLPPSALEHEENAMQDTDFNVSKIVYILS